MTADRAEVARFIRRMADLYEAGELDSFEWCQRLERAYDPQPVPEATHYYKDTDGRYDYHEKLLHYLDYSRVNARGSSLRYRGNRHLFLEALEDVEEKVRKAHDEYWKAIHLREQEYRRNTLLRDWYGTEEVEGAEPDLFGAKERRRRMTKKAAAKRYGHGVQKAKKDAEKMMAKAPKDGPQRHRWLKERGL